MKWKFILVNSADLSPIVELTLARDKSVEVVHNRPGAANFSYPLDDQFADEIVPYATGIKALRYNWRASEIAGENVYDTIWSGYVQTIDQDVTGNKMSVNCVGWLARLEKRFLRETKTYSYVEDVSTDDGDIVLDLLAEMNENPASDTYVFTPMVGSSTLTLLEIGSKLPNEGVGGDTAYEEAYRGQVYDKHQQVYQAIIDITEIENGCDIHVDPNTRELNIYRKRMRDLPGVKFGFQAWPNNIKQFSCQIETDKTVNYLVVYGAPSSVPRYQDDDPSQALFGPIEEIIQLSDVVEDEDGPSILQYYASSEVLFRAMPLQTYNLTPNPYTRGSSVPEPFVDYQDGDKVRFSAKHLPRIDIVDQEVRIFGISVKIDENGNEMLDALQLRPT